MQERASSTERLKPKNALVIVFPDSRTTRIKSDFKPGISPFIDQIRETNTTLIDRYKKNNYKSVALVYSDTTEESFSYLYPKQLFDQVIKSRFTFDEFNRRNFFNDELLSLVSHNFSRPGQKIVVGGYHAQDCVANFASVARNYGIKCNVDLKLTDKLPLLLINHQARNMFSKSIFEDNRKDDLRIWQNQKRNIEEIIQKKQRIFA